MVEWSDEQIGKFVYLLRTELLKTKEYKNFDWHSLLDSCGVDKKEHALFCRSFGLSLRKTNIPDFAYLHEIPYVPSAVLEPLYREAVECVRRDRLKISNLSRDLTNQRLETSKLRMHVNMLERHCEEFVANKERLVDEYISENPWKVLWKLLKWRF